MAQYRLGLSMCYGVRSRRDRCLILAGALLAVTLTACGGPSPSDTSLVRTLNAFVPAAGNSSTLIISGGFAALSGDAGVSFGQFAAGGSYAHVLMGTFNPTAAGSGLSSTMAFATPPTVVGNDTAYTLIAAGQDGQTGTLLPQFLLAPNYTPGLLTIPAASVAVRVVNVSLNANPIAVYPTSGGVPVTTQAIGPSTVTYGFDPAANAYTAQTLAQLKPIAVVDTTSTGVALSVTAASNLNSFTFTAGQAYTLYVYGQPGGVMQPFTATWVLDYPVH